MSSSWSNLPLDLLISIRNKLQNADILSFRSVCSQWRYASPIPNPCPLFRISFNDINNEKNMVRFTNGFDKDISRDHLIPLPFSLSSPVLSYFTCSNGWLIFINRNNETLHLFDPVSNRKLILPPLYPKLLRYYKKVKPTGHDTYRLYLWKVVVSSSIDASIAVACIVQIDDRSSIFTDRRFVFCRHADDDCPRWNFLMEDSKGIIDISLAGDGRFYVIGEDCKFYMLDERPPQIKLMKIKLWLPKHILEFDSDISPPTKRLPTSFYGLEATGETNLNIYGTCLQNRDGRLHMSMKINLAELQGNGKNSDIACDNASWSYRLENMESLTYFFRPSLREHHSMFRVKYSIKKS